MAVEVRDAALLGDAFPDGRCEATLISSAIMLGRRRFLRASRYHVRGGQRAEGADTAGRLDWYTGRARLGDGDAGGGGGGEGGGGGRVGGGEGGVGWWAWSLETSRQAVENALCTRLHEMPRIASRPPVHRQADRQAARSSVLSGAVPEPDFLHGEPWECSGRAHC